jgi:hypothetical protein
VGTRDVARGPRSNCCDISGGVTHFRSEPSGVYLPHLHTRALGDRPRRKAASHVLDILPCGSVPPARFNTPCLCREPDHGDSFSERGDRSERSPGGYDNKSTGVGLCLTLGSPLVKVRQIARRPIAAEHRTVPSIDPGSRGKSGR